MQIATDWIRVRVSTTPPTNAAAWQAEIDDPDVADQNSLSSTSATHIGLGLRKPESGAVVIHAGITIYALHREDGIQLVARDFGVADFTANDAQLHDIEPDLAFVHSPGAHSYWLVSPVVTSGTVLLIRTIDQLPFGSVNP